jgi:hypothetical protein
MHIKNYYLGTPLARFEYMKMLLSQFPEEIVTKCNLDTLAVDGWVYIETRKGMYGLKQAGVLSNQLLQTRLATFGYYPSRHTPGLWLHKTRPIAFSLVLEDFVVKYVGKQHAYNHRNALLIAYDLTADWAETVYSDMTLRWDYKNRTCDISMPGYVSNMLSKFQMTPPSIHNTHHPETSRQFMAPKLNMRQKTRHCHSWPNNLSQYKKSQDPSFTTSERWTQPS